MTMSPCALTDPKSHNLTLVKSDLKTKMLSNLTSKWHKFLECIHSSAAPICLATRLELVSPMPKSLTLLVTVIATNMGSRRQMTGMMTRGRNPRPLRRRSASGLGRRRQSRRHQSKENVRVPSAGRHLLREMLCFSISRRPKAVRQRLALISLLASRYKHIA